MSHMRQARGPVSSSLEGYTDTVVDQQYVLIEASPHADVSIIAPTVQSYMYIPYTGKIWPFGEFYRRSPN